MTEAARPAHVLDGLSPEQQGDVARVLVARCAQHVADAVDAAGGDAAPLRALPAPPRDLEGWAVVMLGDVLPAAFVACGVGDGARAMRLSVDRLARREDAITFAQALMVLAPWLDAVAGQVQGLIRSEGFNAPSLARSSLWSTLLAMRDLCAGQPRSATEHARDAARAAPSLVRARELLGREPHMMVVTEAMDAGTEGAIREAEAQRSIVARLVSA